MKHPKKSRKKEGPEERARIDRIMGQIHRLKEKGIAQAEEERKLNQEFIPLGAEVRQIIEHIREPGYLGKYLDKYEEVIALLRKIKESQERLQLSTLRILSLNPEISFTEGAAKIRTAAIRLLNEKIFPITEQIHALDTELRAIKKAARRNRTEAIEKAELFEASDLLKELKAKHRQIKLN